MLVMGGAILFGQSARDPDPARYAAESLQHFQALLRLNTSNPPGNERLVTDYLKSVLEKDGIPVRTLCPGAGQTKPGRALEGQRDEASRPADGPLGRRDR